jgi:chromate transporter
VVDAAMKPDLGILSTLAANFALLSLFAVGGAIATIPEMHRVAVEANEWMTDRQFTEMFAIAQLAPGPNVIIVTLIGYHVAGVVGALTTTIAMCVPTCVLTYYVGLVWERFRNAPWRIAIQTGLTPLSVGLIGASAFLLSRAAGHNWVAILITVTTAGLAHFTRINPIWMFAVAAAAGAAGFID